MAVNKPTGDNARKGAVKKRTQLKTVVMGKPAWTKRDKTSGEFMAVKKSAKKFKGVGGEKGSAALRRRSTMFFFFSNRLGCLGSILVSAAITIALLFLFGVFR